MPMMKHIGLFLLPVSLTAVGVAWYMDLLTPEMQAPRGAQEPMTVQVPVRAPEPVKLRPSFETLDYPEVTQLAQLQREWPSAELSRSMGTFVGQDYVSNESVPGEQSLLSVPEKTKQTSQTKVGQDDLGLSLDDLDLSSLSPDLAMKVENAMANNDQPTRSEAQMNDLEHDARQWHGRLPALNLQTHMYSSDTKRRWVKINNVEYHQGDVVDGQITLKEIQPQAVIVEFQGEQIRIPALYEWKG
ncbi:general secretion pathway protein GspB [Vibrio harveyi]|nr:general secretion pathway protein GspB [Vibrio harveyi]